MKKNWKCVFITAVVVIILAANSSLAFAAPVSAKPLQMNVLPHGVALTESELATVKGEGFLATFGGAISGGLAGFGAYAADYLWDTYVQDEETSWDWEECGDRVVSGMVSGAIGATVGAWWAP